MRITSLVENTTTKGFPVEHGLSLHIEMNDGRRILFDMGQGTLFATNAKRAGIDPSKADLAIVSHGHYDHGGGLATYLSYPETPRYIYTKKHSSHTTRCAKQASTISGSTRHSPITNASSFAAGNKISGPG